MRRFARDNGLSLLFGALFAIALTGQSLVGWRANVAERAADGAPGPGWWEYVTSPAFGGAVMENWQSEFLQFALFVVATVWLVQRGSATSSDVDEAGLEDDRTQLVGRSTPPDGPAIARWDNAVTRLYEQSLLLVMAAIFVATWAAQSLNNWRDYMEERGVSISWGAYVVSPDFWERTLQNWQSEFLAVGSMAVFTIYLRQRGSPESKPVGAPHDETGAA
jgi:hypothetical protein